jgi:4-amino-4-deoxy-L-arabinose transferase-like glycosyltransferase
MSLSTSTISGRREILLVTFCLLIAFALRFYTFDQKSLWMDEIYTFEDSRDDFGGQLRFYADNPTFLHPPLFFILTHQFYPFTKPERDLRIIPLIFGTLSIPMIFFLSRAFSASIALPCTISLTFMAYHISLSQDGRSYAFLMFIGMASIYFFMRHLKTLQKRYLIGVGVPFAILFHTSYSSIPFIALSQLLWFYQPNREGERPRWTSFLILNGFTLLLCLPWILFVTSNYEGQSINHPFHTEDPGSFGYILYGVLHDWVPQLPLMIVSVILLISSAYFLKNRRNAFVLISIFVLPIGGLYLYCKLFDVKHFITSRYFINFLPLFFVTIYLSLDALELRLDRLKRFMRFKLLFVILFIVSNLVILPLYYRSEKQDLRGLVNYLKGQLQKGDKIFVATTGYIPGMLHYFGTHPEGRHHFTLSQKDSEGRVEHTKSFIYDNTTFTIHYSKVCCTQYVSDGNRLWVVVGKWTAEKLRKESPCVLKGYFDGSFLNFNRFPTDASMYLFLWDPKSQGEKGIDMLIE